MQFIDGVVIAIIPQGFRIVTNWGSEQDVHTMTPGPALDLAVGDRVHVTGGLAPDGTFATSSIYRTMPNGESVDVPDQPKARNLTPASARPPDFAVYYQNHSAPLPPPPSWQQSIWIGPGLEGVVEMIPGDRSPLNPVWQERFPLQDTHLDWLHQVLRDKGAFREEWQTRRDVPIGAGSEQLTVTADGRNVTIPAFVQDDRDRAARAMFAATTALVPPAILERLTATRTAYVAQARARLDGPGPIPDPHFPLTNDAIFDPIAVVIAAFLGGPIAGSALIALNFRRLHDPGPAALIAVAGGLVATVILILLPVSRGISLGLSTAVAAALGALVGKFQGGLIEAHRGRGGRVGSRWAEVGIGLIFIVVQFGVVYLLVNAGILG